MKALNSVGISTEWGLAVIRIVTGIIFFAHGWQKMFMFGFEGTAGFFANVGIPAPMMMATLVTLVEFFGGLALIVGLGTRLAAIPLAITMLVALFTVHLANGFFISNSGYEFVLILFAASVTLVLSGAGALSVDSWLANRETVSTSEQKLAAT